MDEQQTILIVDDEGLNISTLSTCLKDKYRLLAAKNGKQALERLHANPVDLVLLDIMMPEMDGYEVLRRMKNHDTTRDIPVIFITAKSEDQDETRGLQLGAVDYIKKPFYQPIVQIRVATHLELRMKNKMLAELASLDGLTNIPNRRKFDLEFETEWKRAHRDDTPLCLFMIDVDEFKAFNDNYGHAAGDECLKSIAHTLQLCTNRPGDFLGRYGGEEFVILLPNTRVEGARNVAQAALEAVRKTKTPHEYANTAPFVTISLGGAVVHPAQSDCTQADLLRNADQMLYQAKNRGRNTFQITDMDSDKSVECEKNSA